MGIGSIAREIASFAVTFTWIFVVIWIVVDFKRKRKDIKILETCSVNMMAAAEKFSKAMNEYNSIQTGQNPALMLMQNLVLAADGIPHDAAQRYLRHGEEAILILKMHCHECRNTCHTEDMPTLCARDKQCPTQDIINKLVVGD